MDDEPVLQPTQQVSTGRQISSSDYEPRQTIQTLSSTPAKNMSLSSFPSGGHHNCGANCQRTHGLSNTIPSKEQKRLNDSTQQSIQDAFHNIYDSNQGFNFSHSSYEDLIMQPSPREQRKSSPFGRSTNWPTFDRDIPKAKNESSQSKPVQKEKKSITTKTFAKGMMDVSLLSSNATQLRSVLSNEDHEFYKLLLWLITLSIILQVLSSVLLLMSDYFKTDVKEKDELNQGKRKFLNFVSLAMVTIVTSLNILISVFSYPTSHVNVGNTLPSSSPAGQMNVPRFSESSMQGSRAEL